MSESIGTSIRIGGELPATKVALLLETIQKDMFEITDGPETLNDLLDAIKNDKPSVVEDYQTMGAWMRSKNSARNINSPTPIPAIPPVNTQPLYHTGSQA